MRHDSKVLRGIFMAAALTLAPLSAEANAAADQSQQFTPEQVRQDIDKAVELFLTVHPDPDYSFNPADLKAAAQALKAEADHAMTEREVWTLMARLNPVLKDAHAALYYPALKKNIEADLKAGGHMLPLTVYIGDDGVPRLTGVRTAEVNVKDAPAILSIDGVDAGKIVDAMMARSQGDSAQFRHAYVAKRFAGLHWELYGGSDSYKVSLKTADGVKTIDVAGMTTPMRPATEPLEDKVARKILPNHIGYLRIDAFVYPPEQEKAFFAFMQTSWQAFHDAGVKDVIIDVRNNGGGTDHYWQMGIAPYVTDKSFPFLSYFKIRLTERNLKLGPLKGPLNSIQEGPMRMMVPVKPEEPLRIPGKAYLLEGPFSYSSTILFLTAMQDAHSAVIAGQPTGGRSCPTGRIEQFTLENTGMEMTVPTLIFTRPAGPETCMAPVQPDIAVPENPANSFTAVEALAAKITAARQQ